jgi:hypothetical protein
MLRLFLFISIITTLHANTLKRADRYLKANNTQKAKEYYKKACDEGIKKGCEKLESLQSPITKAFTLIGQSKGEASMPHLKQACQEGFSWACTMYESATGKSALKSSVENSNK